MATPSAISAYDPPGRLPDFPKIPGQLEHWSAAVSRWFDESILEQKKKLGTQPCQYYNAVRDPPAGAVLDQDIVWNAFPGTLRRRWGRAHALRVADHPLPLDRRMNAPAPYFDGLQWAGLAYRPQDEYCEWRVERDPLGRIVRVTFTSEPPEYWQALHGDTVRADDPDGPIGDSPFPGDRDEVLRLYRKYVSEEVECDDLVAAVDLVRDGAVLVRAGDYNPWNRWNTTDGIIHLSHPSNTLRAEIRLGADATLLRGEPGRLVADADTLIARAAYGGQNRCSDPTIGASVNHLAALGYGVTLANPVGLYMDHLDMTGWTLDGQPVDPDWFTIVRGAPGLIERAVFEVPRELGAVSDVKIGGEPIRFGGQLAECITVKLVGQAAIQAGFDNDPVPFRHNALAEAGNPWMVSSSEAGAEPPLGTVPILTYPQAISASRGLEEPVRARTPPWSRAA